MLWINLLLFEQIFSTLVLLYETAPYQGLFLNEAVSMPLTMQKPNDKQAI